MVKVVWAHGLEGSPEGTKARAVRAAGFDLIAPDCRMKVLAERIVMLEEVLSAHDGVVLAGSSYGGLAALYLANSRAFSIKGLLLMAPALQWKEEPVFEPSALTVDVPFEVIHGTNDAVIPLSVSEALLSRCPQGVLHTPADDHRLSQSLPLIIETLTRLCTS